MRFPPIVVLAGIPVLLLVAIVMMSWYTVAEGHVGIVKRWSEAKFQVGPGLHFKLPIADTVEHIEVRQRKNVEKLAAATSNQLPATATVSINWTANKTSAMDLFVSYGGLDQFEERILDPKLRSASKAAISKYTASEIIREREKVVSTIMDNMVAALEGFPITVNSPQLEDITLPPAYMESVQAKERAREDAIREKHNLERQRLESLRAVNTAEANAKAVRLAADAQAYQLITTSRAEAEASGVVNRALAQSPHYIELVKAKAWDGKLPVTMLGSGANTLLSLPLK